jgi:serine O-acetyltransferase
MNMSDIKEYIKSDLYRYYGEDSLLIAIKAYLFNRSFKYTFWLRMCKSKNLVVKVIAVLIHRMLSTRYSIQIPYKTKIGYGLYIGHGTSLIVSPFTKIGNNVNLSQFTSIGTIKGTGATIGNGVYIGPNVSIVENVIIGDDAVIGAGTVVINSVGDGSVSVGNPNRILAKKNVQDIIKNRYLKCI